MIKIVLKENKNLLNEISVHDVMLTLRSKATTKTMFNYYLLSINITNLKQTLSRYNNLSEEDKQAYASNLEKEAELLINRLESFIYTAIPDDINNNQKGLSAAYLKKWFLYSYDSFLKFIKNNSQGYLLGTLKHDLENYFMMHDFVLPEQRDIMNLDFMELGLAVEGAEPKYKANLEKKDYANASKGTEVIYEDEKWKIFIPHNKGAACELGKGTSWCTAAPGLDYYAHYHKPDDPLFVIYRKPVSNQEKEIVRDNPDLNGVLEKFQFHYGTGQFMNPDDESIINNEYGIKVFNEVNSILKSTVQSRYPQIFDNMIETDLGPSQLKRHSDSSYDSESIKIYYMNLARQSVYGGKDKPSQINIERNKYAKNGYDTFKFEWLMPYQSKEAAQPGLWTGRDIEPAMIEIIYVIDESRFYLNNCTWTFEEFTFASWHPGESEKVDFRLDNFARFQSDHNLPYYLDDAETKRNMEPWTSHFQQFFETEIKPNPDAYAMKVLKKYLPDDIKKEYGLEDEIKENLATKNLHVFDDYLNESLLNEITIEQAEQTLASKATANPDLIKRYPVINSKKWSYTPDDVMRDIGL